ncbi:hypothetical protein QTN25_008788 [Entamoeba marina]
MSTIISKQEEKEMWRMGYGKKTNSQILRLDTLSLLYSLIGGQVFLKMYQRTSTNTLFNFPISMIFSPEGEELFNESEIPNKNVKNEAQNALVKLLEKCGVKFVKKLTKPAKGKPTNVNITYCTIPDNDLFKNVPPHLRGVKLSKEQFENLIGMVLYNELEQPMGKKKQKITHILLCHGNRPLPPNINNSQVHVLYVETILPLQEKIPASISETSKENRTFGCDTIHRNTLKFKITSPQPDTAKQGSIVEKKIEDDSVSLSGSILNATRKECSSQPFQQLKKMPIIGEQNKEGDYSSYSKNSFFDETTLNSQFENEQPMELYQEDKEDNQFIFMKTYQAGNSVDTGNNVSLITPYGKIKWEKNGLSIKYLEYDSFKYQ